MREAVGLKTPAARRTTLMEKSFGLLSNPHSQNRKVLDVMAVAKEKGLGGL